jgi:hypothetical protein
MTYPQTISSIQKLLSSAGAALVTAVSAAGCGGSALESAPVAPSATPALTLSAEAGESASFEAFGKGTDKGEHKGEDRDNSDSGKGSGSGVETTTTSTPRPVPAAD